jgi:DNA topoisomerase-1
MAQIGEGEDSEKPRFAPLRKDQSIETITLEEALKLFDLPRTIGEYEEAVLVVSNGRFGPYIKHKNSFYSLKKGLDDPLTIELDRCIEIIHEKRLAESAKVIRIFDQDPEMQILNGRWGPYISYKKANYKIPKKADPEKLTFEDCMQIVSGTPASRSKRRKS